MEIKEKLFEEFTKKIEEKYNNMAKIQTNFLNHHFKEFLVENNLKIEEFKEEYLAKFFNEYLDFSAEDTFDVAGNHSMLINFSLFCKEKGINWDFLKDQDYLSKNKDSVSDLEVDEWAVSSIFREFADYAAMTEDKFLKILVKRGFKESKAKTTINRLVKKGKFLSPKKGYVQLIKKKK